MSKKGNPVNLSDLATAIANSKPKAEPTPNPKPKPAFIGNVESKFLDAALDKIVQPLHPNFVAAANSGTLACYAQFQGAAVEAQKLAISPKEQCIAVGKKLVGDVRAYVTFWLTLASNVAFNAHMQCNQIERAVDPEALESSLDAMGDDHAYELGDIPLFDRSMNNRAAEREPREPVEAPYCETVEGVYDAVRYIQEWISLAFMQFTVGQRDFWGIEDLVPLAKRGAEVDYAPIYDFDEYREFQQDGWKAKQRQVKAGDALALMAAA